LADAEWREEDQHGGFRYFLRNMMGIVETGNMVRIWGTQQDITRRKQVEEALSRQSADLARSNSDLQQFAYVVSHDLQEPLRMISSYTQMLTKRYKSQLDGDADEFMGFIVAGADRMSQLIRDLLAYSRVVNIEESAFPYIELEGPVYTALMNLRMAIQDSGAQVSKDALPGILGSRVQMVQLFQNLISNAIKYRGEHPLRIHIGFESMDRFWKISVKDNGIGVDNKHAERIFGLFKRLHGSRYPGTGIGLALCKKIVEKHGGKIWVDSHEAQGATFFFTLPRVTRPE
jgi:light-regulated signal transduction histidine kinase (bacteriophytochrome)